MEEQKWDSHACLTELKISTKGMKGPWLRWWNQWKQYFSGIEQQGAQGSGPQWRKTDQVSPMLICVFFNLWAFRGSWSRRGQACSEANGCLSNSGKLKEAHTCRVRQVQSCLEHEECGGVQILVRPKWQEFAESQRKGDDVESTRMAWPALPNCLWPGTV